MSKMIEVEGRCPACGNSTLFVGEGGYLTCSMRPCPMPEAASRLLAEVSTDHIVETKDGYHFTMEHPLIERLDGALLDCLLYQALESMPPTIPGRYRYTPRTNVGPNEFGWSVHPIGDD